MLSAKLFAGFAVCLFGLMLLCRLGIVSPGTVGLRAHGVAYGPYFWQMFSGIICAAVALAYFGTEKTASRPPNDTVGLLSFALVSVPILLWIIASFNAGALMQNMHFVALLFVALAAFLVGVLISAVNVLWAVLH
jgi:hypothetical protein